MSYEILRRRAEAFMRPDIDIDVLLITELAKDSWTRAKTLHKDIPRTRS